jgi:RNA polymerase sigma factor (sigma-70 family)
MTDVDSQDDGLLLAAFAETGDEAAFAAIVRRHGRMVQATCLRVLGNFHETQDVAQAVFLTLAHKAARLRKDPSVGGWLHHVATCLARNARSAAQSRKRREEKSMEEITTVAPAADVRALREELDHAVEQLPARYRLPLMLFHFEEQSLEETARLLGLKASTASARLVRGREMLRAKLVRRGVAVGSVGALTTLLSAEAGAAVLPATFVSATVKGAALATAGKMAAGVGSGIISAHVAALTKGVLKAMFVTQIKQVTAVVVVGAAVVGAAVAGVVAVAGVGGGGVMATQFSSPAWRNCAASRDLADAGIRVFQVGGWGHESCGWATPAELRRRTMPATDYVKAWAASQEREVLWLSSNTVAIIGTKAELDVLKQQARGDAASTEAILAKLGPKVGPESAGRERQGDEPPKQDQVTLRKAFHAVHGKAQMSAAIELCAAGGDDGLAFLKAELSKNGAITADMSSRFTQALGFHGGPDAIGMLQDFLSNPRIDAQMAANNVEVGGNGPLYSDQHRLQIFAAMALCRNASTAAVEVLRVGLKSEDAKTAVGAACGLEMLGGKTGLELATLALTHTDPEVRRAGAYGAYRAHGERALPLMKQALADQDAGVRKMAATGLGSIGGDKARDLIRRQLAVEKDPDVLKTLEDAQKRIEKR